MPPKTGNKGKSIVAKLHGPAVDAALYEDPDVVDVVEELLRTADEWAPKNTTKAYAPKVKEWDDWCSSRYPPVPDEWPPREEWPSTAFMPGNLVDEGKLVLFMKTCVLNRAPKKGKRLANFHQRSVSLYPIRFSSN